MVKNNQVKVCDDVLCILVSDIYSTAGDVDYESFYITMKSNYHDCDDARELAFDTKVHNYGNNNFIVDIVCDISCVEYPYIYSVPLVASLKTSRLRSYTSSPLYFVYSSIPGL